MRELASRGTDFECKTESGYVINNFTFILILLIYHLLNSITAFCFAVYSGNLEAIGDIIRYQMAKTNEDYTTTSKVYFLLFPYCNLSNSFTEAHP